MWGAKKIMAIKIQKIATGEVIELKNTGYHEGKPFVFGKGFPSRWAAKYPMFLVTGNILASGSYNKYELNFIDGAGYELIADDKKHAPRPRKPKGQPEPEPTPKDEPTPTEEYTEEYKLEDVENYALECVECGVKPSVVWKEMGKYGDDRKRLFGLLCEKLVLDPNHTLEELDAKMAQRIKPKTEPKEEPKTEPKATFATGSLESGLASVFAPVFNQVAEQIEANIRAKVDAEMSELKRVAEEKARVLKIELPDGREGKVEGLTMEGFDDMVRDLNNGYNIYLYGPAGTGKSHTAKQLAEALGLPFYELNQVEFAHEVCGYGDASGKFVSTPAYEAATKGGLLFFDEWDRSAQAATTVVNTMLANRRFTFPVIGNVEMHPNFRVVAAGNTTMSGADNNYVAANVIDASSRDRFIFYKTDYDERIELPVMARGDKELVEFMQELRRGIKASNIQMVASMRSTKYLKEHEANKKTALERGLLKGMDAEDIRVVAEHMNMEGNSWYNALKELGWS